MTSLRPSNNDLAQNCWIRSGSCRGSEALEHAELVCCNAETLFSRVVGARVAVTRAAELPVSSVKVARHSCRRRRGVELNSAARDQGRSRTKFQFELAQSVLIWRREQKRTWMPRSAEER